MKLGVIADDFTGASDIALTLSEGGLSTAQFIGVPTKSIPDVDAGVVALKSRTEPVQDAIANSLQACDWLRSQGCTQIIFKVCSTFDSTQAGNIGQVAQALAAHLGETHVAVCPAFPENGRSVYQGHLFVGDKLLNESGMQNHPLTPMTDSDLRRVLGAQTDWQVKHVPSAVISRGAEEIQAQMSGAPAMFILDAIRDDDLIKIGAALSDRKLMVGGSGIAIGLPANFGASETDMTFAPQQGAGVILSGSCSTATRAQVEAYAAIAPSMQIAPDQLMNDAYDTDEICNWVLAQSDAPIIYSSASPETVGDAQNKFGNAQIAERIERFFSTLAQKLVSAGIERIVVAGGETSGAVVTGLDADILEIGPRIAAGVPAVSVPGRSLTLALKSGNFGEVDFFARALDVLKGEYE